MPTKSSTPYSPPEEPEIDKKRFHSICAHIKKVQSILTNGADLSISEVISFSQSIIYMRTAANALNTKYRRNRKVP